MAQHIEGRVREHRVHGGGGRQNGFFRFGEKGEIEIMGWYVDDGLMATNSTASMERMIGDVKGSFDIQDLGDLTRLLSICIDKSRPRDYSYFSAFIPSEKCRRSWPLPASPGRNRGFARLPSAKVSRYPRLPLEEKFRKYGFPLLVFYLLDNLHFILIQLLFPLPPASAASNRSSPPPTAPNLPSFCSPARLPLQPLPSSIHCSHPRSTPPILILLLPSSPSSLSATSLASPSPSTLSCSFSFALPRVELVDKS